jgi:hypothetical protein
MSLMADIFAYTASSSTDAPKYRIVYVSIPPPSARCSSPDSDRRGAVSIGPGKLPRQPAEVPGACRVETEQAR